LPAENGNAVKNLQSLGTRRALQKQIEAIQERTVEKFGREQERITNAIAAVNQEAEELGQVAGLEIAELEGRRPGIEARQLELDRTGFVVDLQLQAVRGYFQETLQSFQALLAQFRGLKETETLAAAGAAAAAPAAAAAQGPAVKEAVESAALAEGAAGVVTAKAVTPATSTDTGEEGRREGPAVVTAAPAAERAEEPTGVRPEELPPLGEGMGLDALATGAPSAEVRAALAAPPPAAAAPEEPAAPAGTATVGTQPAARGKKGKKERRAAAALERMRAAAATADEALNKS
jgi:hypothetical protein